MNDDDSTQDIPVVPAAEASAPGPIPEGRGPRPPRTAVERAKLFGLSLLATGVATSLASAGVRAVTGTEHERLVEREGGGTIAVAAAADTCWKVEALDVRLRAVGVTEVVPDPDADPDVTDEAAVLERRGCGAADVALPSEAVFGTLRLLVEQSDPDVRSDVVALAWSGRQVVYGGVLADADATRSQAYVLESGRRGTVRVVDGEQEAELDGAFVASPGMQVTGRPAALAERLGLDPRLRTDALTSLGQGFATWQVSDVEPIRKDLDRARAIGESALAWRELLEMLQTRDASGLRDWLERAERGGHGRALEKRVDALRPLAAERVWTKLSAEAAEEPDVPAQTWAGRLEVLAAVAAIDPARDAELAPVRSAWEAARSRAEQQEPLDG